MKGTGGLYPEEFQFAVTEFQLNIVGDYDFDIVTFESGAGNIQYSTVNGNQDCRAGCRSRRQARRGGHSGSAGIDRGAGRALTPRPGKGRRA
jgi:hypothetical protein